MLTVFNQMIPLLLYISFFALFLLFANLSEQHPQGKWYGLISYVTVGSFLSMFIFYGWNDPEAPYSIWIPALVGLCFFSPFVRRQLARLLPINPNHHVHTVALCLSIIIFIEMFSTLEKGLDVINRSTPSLNHVEALQLLWTQEILFVILSFFGVGWLIRRNLRETCQRLGLVKISWKECLQAIGFSLVLVIFAFTIEQLVSLTSHRIDPAAYELTEKRLGALHHSMIGIFSLGIAAALGEEILFRGAIQPRFGLSFTSILFALTHTNYGMSVATFILLVGGFFLGWIRMRYHTTMAIIVHMLYNMLLVLISYIIS